MSNNPRPIRLHVFIPETINGVHIATAFRKIQNMEIAKPNVYINVPLNDIMTDAYLLVILDLDSEDSQGKDFMRCLQESKEFIVRNNDRVKWLEVTVTVMHLWISSSQPSLPATISGRCKQFLPPREWKLNGDGLKLAVAVREPGNILLPPFYYIVFATDSRSIVFLNLAIKHISSLKINQIDSNINILLSIINDFFSYKMLSDAMIIS